MRYQLLACDFDGTLAHHGQVLDSTLNALRRLRESGRRLVLVTGREMADLERLLPSMNLFELIVAENGALLYDPHKHEEHLLSDPPPPRLIDALRARAVQPLSVGKGIIATWEPHQHTALDLIHEHGLEWHVIFNKGAVMILPSGVNKATGLQAALDRLHVSFHNAVGVGDAENDHAFLSACEFGVAVENALPVLKERVDFTTRNGHGDGVVELIDMLLEDDLRRFGDRLERHSLLLGTLEKNDVRVPSYGINVLVAGSSGGGKSTCATGFIEELTERDYQYCLLDPEGDYQALEKAVVLGEKNKRPTLDEINSVLEASRQHCVINLLGVPLRERPEYMDRLLPQLTGLRAHLGRPHWIIFDEAHHLFPAGRKLAAEAFPREAVNLLFVTVHPDQLLAELREMVDLLIVVGKQPAATIQSFCAVCDVPEPEQLPDTLRPDEAIGWWVKTGENPFRFTPRPPVSQQQRHRRKYAEGELAPEKSFFFRGPDGKLNLRASNLVLFMQLADGVDDATWVYHLQRGDYSKWFEGCIGDEELAGEAALVEQNKALTAEESRAQIRQLVASRYTAPA